MSKLRRAAVQQNSDVRYSDRGFIYAEEGRSGHITGVVAFGKTSSRPPLNQVPRGILFYNTDINALQLSDPENSQWINILTGSGFCSILGLPTDGDFSDGAIYINPDGTIADAVDSINEYLIGCCGSGVVFYASHLGTTDGSTNGYLVDPLFTVGRVSTPTNSGNPFYTGGWDNDTNRDLTRTSSLNWNLNSGEKITDLQSGTISVEFYDGSNSLIHTETITLDGTTNNQNSTPSGYAGVNSLVNFGSKIEGVFGTQLPNSILLNSKSGYLKIKAIQNTGLGTYQQELDYFNDKGGSPSFISTSISLNAAIIKYLSGVKFASTSGTSYSSLLFLTSISGIWADSYRADPLLVGSNNLGVSNYTIQYNSSDVKKNGISPPASPFKYDEDFVYSGVKNITSAILNPDINGNFAQAAFTGRDPFYSSVSAPITPMILINTYPAGSTDVLEVFLDEEYRLLPNSGVSALSSINGTGRGLLTWDSTQSLATSGGLQVFNGSLIYPSTDYSSIDPSGNPDYSGLPSILGDEIYVRRFRDSLGYSRSNGVFRIEGLSEAARISGTILVDLRVVGTHISGSGTQGPGNEGTGWLSLNTTYNNATFVGDDGDGCFVTTGGYSSPYFEFTLGGFSTAYAANKAIEVRVTYKNPSGLSTKITRIQITNWN